MGFLTFFLIVGLIAFVIEYWMAKHCYIQEEYHYSKEPVRRFAFRNFHLLWLILLNIIPIANVIGFIVITCMWLCESSVHVWITPPEELQDEVKQSRLDKWLSKKL